MGISRSVTLLKGSDKALQVKSYKAWKAQLSNKVSNLGYASGEALKRKVDEVENLSFAWLVYLQILITYNFAQ